MAVTASSWERNVRRAGWWFAFPAALLLILVYVVPIGMNIWYGFTRYNLLSKPVFVGLANYTGILHDALFWWSAFNTVVFTVVLVSLGTVLSLAVAMVLNQSVAGVAIYRLIVYLPQTISYASIALIWAWLFDAQYGPIDQMIQLFGGQPVNWLTSPSLALPSIILTSLWHGTSYYMIIFLAALQNVSPALVEAAQLDGANRRQVFRYVTLPSIQSAILFVLLTWTIGALQLFTQPYVMTNGGPANDTLSIVMKIYEDGFQYLKLGYASAESMILFLVTLLLSIVFVRNFRRSIA